MRAIHGRELDDYNPIENATEDLVLSRYFIHGNNCSASELSEGRRGNSRCNCRAERRAHVLAFVCDD